MENITNKSFQTNSVPQTNFSETLNEDNLTPVIKHKRFSNWGLGIGILSFLFMMTFFLMFFGMALSPIGIIFSIVNFITSTKQHDYKKVGFALLGFLLSTYVLFSTIYALHQPLG